MTTETTMTETQATDEALLLLVRKMRRIHPDAFREVWAKLPDGAQTALLIAETRADTHREQVGIANLRYSDDPYGIGEITEE
jgi:hypothetical protein